MRTPALFKQICAKPHMFRTLIVSSNRKCKRVFRSTEVQSNGHFADCNWKCLGSVQHADLPDNSLSPFAIAAAGAPNSHSPAVSVPLSSRPPLSDSGIARETPAGASAKQHADTSGSSGTAWLPADFDVRIVEQEAGGNQNSMFSSVSRHVIRLLCLLV